jgi:hypothetical protein
VSRESIRCTRCNAVNDITAFACAACGGSLVTSGAERWQSARDRDMVVAAEREAARERGAFARRILVGIVVAIALAGTTWFVLGWYQQGHYFRGEPLYDQQPASHWVEQLKSDDRYLRRRAALALDTLSDRFNEKTATEVVPALKTALSDDDDVVRLRARSALDKIARLTGVT